MNQTRAESLRLLDAFKGFRDSSRQRYLVPVTRTSRPIFSSPSSLTTFRDSLSHILLIVFNSYYSSYQNFIFSTLFQNDF